MKARAKQRRFFRKPIQPNICVLESIQFADGELKDYMDFIGRDLFTAPLLETLHQFREADNFGSLIRPVMTDVEYVLRLLEQKNVEGELFLYQIHPKVLKALQQADYLSPKYHVVIANPPYMGGKGMNERLGAWVKDNYPISKSDLFAVFAERIMDIVQTGGFIGLMSPFTWMFLSSYEKLRSRILNENTLITLVRPEYHAFFESAYVPICAFTLFLNVMPEYKGTFIDLQKFYGADLQPVKALEAIANHDCGWFYRASSEDFKKIPGSPIAYSASIKLIECFASLEALSALADCRAGLTTGDNTIFQREWSEVSVSSIFFNAVNREQALRSEKKWFPCSSGGGFRKWFGNCETLVNWQNDGNEICNFADSNGRLKASPRSKEFYFKEGITWGKISSGKFSPRYLPSGFIFDDTGQSAFPSRSMIDPWQLTALVCSKTSPYFLSFLSQTLSFNKGDIERIPVPSVFPEVASIANQSIDFAKSDWNAYEISWDFTTIPLLELEYRQPTLIETYTHLRTCWQSITDEMRRLEEENNRLFIETYGLQDEITPEVPLKEITLTCNPYYRYGSDKTENELKALLLADTMREFISYAVGCMFGRYSLDKPGLILANQGETIEDYLKQIPNPTFPADTDNVIPLLDGDWFPDDISERFRQFLRVTFGAEHYDANLKFIEKALGKDIRRYFLRDFYNDHIRRYKKRPIYWLFSSPKGTFNALIYLHRYRPDTVSVVLNDYLREFRTKLVAHRSHLEQVSISTAASAAEKTKALKEIETLRKTIDELESYEREVLYPLATERVEIDLDDGVKVNYGKLGAALKKIPGLDVVDD